MPRLGIRAGLFAICTATIVGIAHAAISQPRALENNETILAGDCAPCVFEDVRFDASGVDARITLSQRVWTRNQQTELQNLNIFRSHRPGLSDRRLESAIFWRHGTAVRASAPDLLEYNRCAVGPRPADCTGDPKLPVAVGRGGVVVLVLRSKTLSGFGRGDYSWLGRIPKGLPAARYGAIVRSPTPLFIEGDLADAPTKNVWRFHGSGHGYFVASTAPSWAHVARTYRRVEEELISSGGKELAVVPRLAKAATTDERIQAYWLWVRRNLTYRHNPNILDGGAAPSSLANLLAERKGDCKDFVLLLRALLARDGVASDSIWVDSTVERGEPWTRLPTARADHVLVYVPSANRYLDPTLASKRPLPTGGSFGYEFAVNTGSGKTGSLDAFSTR